MTKHFMNDIVSKEVENETEPSGSNGKVRAPDVHQNYAGISCRNDCRQCIESSNIYQCRCFIIMRGPLKQISKRLQPGPH